MMCHKPDKFLFVGVSRNLQAVTGECIINTYPMNYAEMTGLLCRVIAEI